MGSVGVPKCLRQTMSEEENDMIWAKEETWSREEMEGFAALVRPWVPAVELRGI